jgi:hypothetical protein
MDCLIVVEELQVERPETEDERDTKDKEKSPLEGKKFFYGFKKTSGPHTLHPQLSSTISMPISFGT